MHPYVSMGCNRTSRTSSVDAVRVLELSTQTRMLRCDAFLLLLIHCAKARIFEAMERTNTRRDVAPCPRIHDPSIVALTHNTRQIVSI